jgi:hypothetical protein
MHFTNNDFFLHSYETIQPTYLELRRFNKKYVWLKDWQFLTESADNFLSFGPLLAAGSIKLSSGRR